MSFVPYSTNVVDERSHSVARGRASFHFAEPAQDAADRNMRYGHARLMLPASGIVLARGPVWNTRGGGAGQV